jgi:hypothetical protein
MTRTAISKKSHSNPNWEYEPMSPEPAHSIDPVPATAVGKTIRVYWGKLQGRNVLHWHDEGSRLKA